MKESTDASVAQRQIEEAAQRRRDEQRIQDLRSQYDEKLQALTAQVDATQEQLEETEGRAAEELRTLQAEHHSKREVSEAAEAQLALDCQRLEKEGVTLKEALAGQVEKTRFASEKATELAKQNSELEAQAKELRRHGSETQGVTASLRQELELCKAEAEASATLFDWERIALKQELNDEIESCRSRIAEAAAEAGRRCAAAQERADGLRSTQAKAVEEAIELRQQLSQAETDAKFAATEHARAAASLQERLAEANTANDALSGELSKAKDAAIHAQEAGDNAGARAAAADRRAAQQSERAAQWEWELGAAQRQLAQNEAELTRVRVENQTFLRADERRRQDAVSDGWQSPRSVEEGVPGELHDVGPPFSSPVVGVLAEKIRQLRDLMQEGLLSEDEFRASKTTLLNAV